jgi:hypothetical protein
VIALLAKDARLLLRNRALLVALLLNPLLLAGVLGAAFQAPPTRLDVAVWSADPDAAPLVAATRAYATVHPATSADDAVGRVRRGEADAALLVPPGFVADLSRLGSNATLRVVVDESDPVRASIARSAVVGGLDAYLQSIVRQKIAQVESLLNLTLHGGTQTIGGVPFTVLGLENARAELMDARTRLTDGSAEAREVDDVVGFLGFAEGFLGDSDVYLTTTAVPLDVQVSGLAHADTRLVSVALPGALVLSLFWTGALAAALLAARERETGVARRLVAAPTPRLLPPASKAIVALLAALLPAALLLALGAAALGADVRDPAATLVVLALASLAAASLGALCAALARASAAAALLAVLVLVPMLLLGGLFYPVAYMPPAAQAVASVLPLTLATDALRGAMLRGATWLELAPDLAGLAAFALAAALLAALASRGRTVP